MKIKLTMTILAVGLLALSVGCSSTKPMYYWGDYSKTLYHSKKKPGAETLAKHQAMLEKVIQESAERDLRIPPGVCAELGYIYATQNDAKRATELFAMEKQTYPESTVLMDRLILQTEKRSQSSAAPESDEQTLEQEKKLGKLDTDESKS